MLEGRENVNITEIKRENRSWERKVRQLTPEGQVLIVTAVTAATAGVGSTIGAGAAGGIGVGDVSSAIATHRCQLK